MEYESYWYWWVLFNCIIWCLIMLRFEICRTDTIAIVISYLCKIGCQYFKTINLLNIFILMDMVLNYVVLSFVKIWFINCVSFWIWYCTNNIATIVLRINSLMPTRYGIGVVISDWLSYKISCMLCILYCCGVVRCFG